MIIKPIPVPAKGPVEKLKLNIATNHVAVYICQTAWPRQRQNPNWRIEVTNIDGRYDPDTQHRIRIACEDTARIFLRRWLSGVAPLLTIETATWHELLAFTTRPKFRVLSPYQQRRTNGHRKWGIPSSDIEPEDEAEQPEFEFEDS